jgi:hypothetical protein
LQKRLKGFADSNCDKVLREGGIDPDKIMNNYGSVMFYDARMCSAYYDVPLSYIIKSDKSGYTIGNTAGPRAVTIVGTRDVLLGGDFFGVNLNSLSPTERGAFSLDQQNTLLHEIIHALFGPDQDDAQLFSNKVFLQNGLSSTDYKNNRTTGAFTACLAKDCKK